MLDDLAQQDPCDLLNTAMVPDSGDENSGDKEDELMGVVDADDNTSNNGYLSNYLMLGQLRTWTTLPTQVTTVMATLAVTTCSHESQTPPQ